MRVRLRVKEVAADKGMSMTKLHIKSEVAYNTIRRIFRDPYAEITTTTLARLAEALGVSTHELIEDVSD
jgi:DNA-binding Xre family transcriptional regulator